MFLLIFPAFFGNIGTEYYYFVILTVAYYVLDKKISLVIVTIYLTLIFGVSKYFISTMTYPQDYKILEIVHYYPCIAASIILVSLAIGLFKFDSIRYQTTVIKHQNVLDSQIIELEKKDNLNTFK